MSVVLLLASGVTFFVGFALVGLLALLPTPKSTATRAALWAAMAVAATLVAISAVPAPIILFVAAALALLAWLIITAAGPHSRQLASPRRAVRILLPLLALAAVALELPHTLIHPLSAANHTTLTVIGDSLSADSGSPCETWPHRLAAQHGFTVHNLAVGGSTCAAARRQADRIADIDGVLVLAIGGNDILQGRTAREYEAGLSALLDAVRKHNGPVAMLELPLPPTHIRFGYVQRRLAAQYRVTLIPRRILATILACPDATVDGIHLTDSGQAALADAVWGCIGPALGGS